MAVAQDDRDIGVSTPLGGDKLVFRHMNMRESLGRLFEIELELLSESDDIVFGDVVGQDMTVRMAVEGGGERYFHGFCTEFSQTGLHGRLATYQAVLRPWLWFLTRTADCRIFQDVKVPDIIKEVFREHGFSDFKDSLSRSYRTWEYCVQYRETDFNFVSRLMEQEGIYYYFEHEDGKHTLVLADSSRAHGVIPGYETVPYYPPSENAVRDEDCITDFSIRKSVQTGAYVLESYDFKKPKADRRTNKSISRGHAGADYEIFDYPGEYLEKGDGKLYVEARLEELQSEHERVSGVGDARGFLSGGLFELENFPRSDQNREYLLVAVQHTARSGVYETGTGDDESSYSCTFEAIDSKEPYRAPRATPKPIVQGPQTAVVVGPSGEEIHTDEFGRVKVQFHWDRLGKADENSSCWVRVSQVWAGKKWGAMHIPRMGHEVIVDFLEGDPDQPIITGRVYNADNMPPYALPDNKTQSGIKSHSTKDAGSENFNEIRFEDKKGEEEMYIHAEKNQTIMVENDKAELVDHDNIEEVTNDETITVGNNRAKQVGVDQSESIGSNKSIDVGKSHTESIGSDKTMSVGANHTESIAKDMSIEIGTNRSIQVGKDIAVTSGKTMTYTAGDNFTISGAKKGLIDIADELTIQCGKAVIQMKKNGDILIDGKKIDVKGSGNIVMKAKKILQN